MDKICLAVIYNHQFTKNIDKLEKVYGGRFEKIYHLMPFYDGDIENVIPIYENSYQFSSYPAQALDKIYNEDYDYYIFMGDDVILHPQMNQENMREYLKIDEDTGYISRNMFTVSDKYILTRAWLPSCIANWLYAENKAELEKLLPDPVEMYNKQKALGLKASLTTENKMRYLFDFAGVQSTNNFFYRYRLDVSEFDFASLLKNYKPKENEPIKYLFPFAGGFSDFFVVPKRYIKDFCYYGGLLASARIFAEVAVPTTFCIVMDKISMPKTTGRKVINYSARDEKRAEFPELYGGSLKRLYNEWNDENILMHPVKYSIWEMDLD